MTGTTLDQQKCEMFLLIVFNKCQSHLQWSYFGIFQLNHNEILYSEWEWQDRVMRSALLVSLVKELVECLKPVLLVFFSLKKLSIMPISRPQRYEWTPITAIQKFWFGLLMLRMMGSFVTANTKQQCWFFFCQYLQGKKK